MGFIKKLISGIISFIQGLFGGLKKSEYFLEYDGKDASSTVSVAPPAPEASQPEPVKPEPAKVESVTVAPKDQPVEAPTPVAAATAVEPSKPAPVATTTEPKVEQTFAPNFLGTLSSSNGRRRPGPSLNYFRDMAKQVGPQ